MQSKTKAIAGKESSLQVRSLRWRRMGVIVLATLVGIWLWQREPRYEGQPLGHWLGAYQSFKNGLGWDRREEESAAVLKRTQGKVVPHLIRLLQKKDSAFDEPWPPGPDNDVLAPTLRNIVRQWGSLPNREQRHRAAEALGFIGHQAKAALPDLHRLMLQTDDYASPAAAGALARIGEEGMSFLVKILREGTKQQKFNACWGLLDAHALSGGAIRALEESLTTDALTVRLEAAQTLRLFDHKPELVARALLPFGAQTDTRHWAGPSLRGQLRSALSRMKDPELISLFREQPAENRKLIIGLLAKDKPAQAEALQRSVGSSDL